MANVHAELIVRNVECLEKIFGGLKTKRLVLWVENNMSQDLCSFLEMAAKTRWSQRRVVAMVKSEDSEGRKIPGVTTNKKGCLVEHALRALERNVFLVQQFSTQARIVHQKFSVLAEGEDRAVAEIIDRIDRDRFPKAIPDTRDFSKSFSATVASAAATQKRGRRRRRRDREDDEEKENDDDDYYDATVATPPSRRQREQQRRRPRRPKRFFTDDSSSSSSSSSSFSSSSSSSSSSGEEANDAAPVAKRKRKKKAIDDEQVADGQPRVESGRRAAIDLQRRQRTYAYPDVSAMLPTEEDRKTTLKTLVRQAEQYVYDPKGKTYSGKKIGERDDMTTALILGLGWLHSNMSVVEDTDLPVHVQRVWRSVGVDPTGKDY